MIKRFPHSIPYGWFFVAYTDEIKKGDVKPLHYFDRDMVIFRNDSGEVGLLDAYCPHLGAHIGHGGVVDGDSVRCPFHSWAFNTEGYVTDVPYAQQIPPKVADKECIKKYPTVEKNQVIWAWYHPKNTAPMFDVLAHDEIGNDEWVDLKRYEWVVNTNVQEIAENGVDIAHFKYVHKMESVPEGDTSYNEHIRDSKASGPRDVQQADGSTKIITSRVHTVQNGAGQKFSRLSGLSETLLMVLVTPINIEQVELRFAFTHKKFPENSMEYKVAQMSIESIIGQGGVAGDIPIWNHKIHRAEPVLCDGDGPIMRYRKYFSQFYVE
jgi:phenylpropionate dioxygenase-like ring-hydroxylating dioxygenase large terminal subunit